MDENNKNVELRLGFDRVLSNLRRYADSVADMTDRDAERKKSLMRDLEELAKLVEQVR